MRRVMRTHSLSPPFHVHVPETVPVHVHLKKSSRIPSAKTSLMKIKEAKMRKEAGNLRATARMKARMPWIPPGSASKREASFKWEGPTHRLEVRPTTDPELSQSRLPVTDLSTDEEDVLHGHVNLYEKKVESLMTEVGSLKSQVELRRKEQLLERQTEKLSASQRVIEEQEEELVEATKELEVTENENALLRQSLEKMREETDHSRLEEATLSQENDMLLRRLVEVEVDGTAAAKQASALQETVGKTRTDTRLSRPQAALLGRQTDLLMEKLETFEGTNRSLRHLLRERRGHEMDVQRLSEQRDVLLGKLAETEAENSRLSAKLLDKEKQAEQIAACLEMEKDNVRTSGELSKALESTRAHLQGQLRSKEAENNRLTVQLQTLEGMLNQQQGETEQLQEQLRGLKRRADKDKEALKRAARAQKLQAAHSEERARLLETETRVAHALSAAESWRRRHAQGLKEKNQLEREITVLSNQVTDLMDQVHSMEDKARAEREGLLGRLHRLTSDSATIKLENQRLRANLSVLEEKLTSSQSEVQQLKTSANQYECLMENYKSQMQKARMEADEHCLKLELVEKEARGARAELELERRRLLGRLVELEPLQERLKCSERHLREAEERTHAHERRSAEQSAVLAELRLKVEQQGTRVETAREKNRLLLEENQQMKDKLGGLERKLEETNLENRGLLQVIAKREETIHCSQRNLEEKSQECSMLARRLEEAMEDSRRQVDQTRERVASRERSAQSRFLDLETQLSHTKVELSHLRRSKEEMERRSQSRLQDLKHRLERSDSTNRSLQNYVQFLKASYANVFGDTVLTRSMLQPPSPI